MLVPDRIRQDNVTSPAVGCGPNAGGAFSQEDYHHPAAAWGAAISVGLVLLKQHELIDGTRVVFNMNHENGGYDCPGCGLTRSFVSLAHGNIGRA